MLTNKSPAGKVATSLVPAGWVHAKLSNRQFLLRERLGKGLHQTFSLDDQTQLTVSVNWQNPRSVKYKHKPIALLSDFGSMSFYNAAAFFLALTGLNIGNNPKRFDALFPVFQSCIPAQVLALFGNLSIAPDIDNKAAEMLILPIRLQTHDSTIVSHVLASMETWDAFLAQPDWAKADDKNLSAQDFTLSIPCVLGSTRITAGDCLSLQVGDVLMIEAPLFDTEGNGSIRLGQRVMSVKVDNSQAISLAHFLGWQQDHGLSLAKDNSEHEENHDYGHEYFDDDLTEYSDNE